MKRFVPVILLASCLFAGATTEQKMSDRMRKIQRAYMAEYDKFEQYCAARGGQHVGTPPKGASGDLGCIPAAPAPVQATPAAPPATPDKK